MLEISLPGIGVPLQLLPGGAVHVPALQTLLVADAHFGKAVTFRRLGVPVPEGTTAGTLDRLDLLIGRTGASRIVFLGDFLHSAWAHSPATLDALSRWRLQNSKLALTLVRGNHDDRAGDPPPALGIDTVDEPLLVPAGGSTLAFCHHPQSLPGAYVLAGHWHPCISLRGAGRDRLRLPCFWFGDVPVNAVGVLPAFGSFTGMHRVDRRPGDRIFAIADDTVREVPA